MQFLEPRSHLLLVSCHPPVQAVQGGMSKLRDAVDWVPGTVGHALAKAEGQILEAEGRMVCRVRGKSWLQCRRSSHPVACCLGLESMAKSPG